MLPFYEIEGSLTATLFEYYARNDIFFNFLREHQSYCIKNHPTLILVTSKIIF